MKKLILLLCDKRKQKFAQQQWKVVFHPWCLTIKLIASPIFVCRWDLKIAHIFLKTQKLFCRVLLENSSKNSPSLTEGPYLSTDSSLELHVWSQVSTTESPHFPLALGASAGSTCWVSGAKGVKNEGRNQKKVEPRLWGSKMQWALEHWKMPEVGTMWSPFFLKLSLSKINETNTYACHLGQNTSLTATY